MPDFSWGDTRLAMQAGIVAASSLPDPQVIWKYQNAGEPKLTYMAISIGSSQTKGQDYIESTYDPNRPAAQAIKRTVRGLREVALELECYTALVADDADALSVMDQVRSSLTLESVRDIFDAVNVSPFDPGDINYLPTIVAAGFRGRATMTVRCYMPALAVTEYVTWIEKAGGTLTTSGGGQGGTNTRPF